MGFFSVRKNGVLQEAVGSSGTVTSIIGTSSQVVASAPDGDVTLSLPQSIATGSSPSFAGATLTGNLVLDTKNISTDTTTGTKIGTGTTQKLGFYNATPVVKPSAYTQTYATADKTHANPTATALTDNTVGTANTTLEALANGTVYATDVGAIRNNFADLAASDNAIIVDLADLKQLVNSLIDDLQALGLVA